MSTSSRIVTDLIEAVQSGDATATNELLGRYRPWLNLLARLELAPALQAKLDASDIAQQTLFLAFRDLPQFRGTTESELTVWLRQILAHVLGHEVRRYRGTQKRDVVMEQSLEQRLGESSVRLQAIMAASGSSPSNKAVKREEEVELAEVLGRVPEDYRDVIVLRNLEGLSYDEIAQRLDRKPGAVRMLWVRALARLKRELA